MSHFSTIQTQIKDRSALLQALNLLGHTINEDQELKVTGEHGIDHPTVNAEVAIETDIGFRWNAQTETYQLVTDLETWKHPVPPERFIDKVTQQYARMVIHNTVKEMGLAVAEEWEMDDNSIEITVTDWNS
tara:strand:+ start:493 stop:885 length:393 start_codon:yes stop_codon:yes gene_type:complete